MEKVMKNHWEAVFQTKDTTKVGWFQQVPRISIEWIGQLNLPKNASKVTREVSGILEFELKAKVDLWHDRAVFHFLTEPNKQQAYRSLAERSMVSGG